MFATLGVILAVVEPQVCHVRLIDPNKIVWEAYQNAPKVDGPLKKPEDFTWKDPFVAKQKGVDVETYALGGLDPKFKNLLAGMFQYMQDVGLKPGITAGYRGPERQKLITRGVRARDPNGSYHGGPPDKRGPGHGLAADVVSTDGDTREQRLANSEQLWKWIKENGTLFGVRLPYSLDYDPGHAVPTWSPEYPKARSSRNSRTVAHNNRKNSKHKYAKLKKSKRHA